MKKQQINYLPKGVCSNNISIEVEDNRIIKVEIRGGCAGNTMGVSRLLEGMEVEEAILRLQGIDCKGKGTSCPDQLAKALISLK